MLWLTADYTLMRRQRARNQLKLSQSVFMTLHIINEAAIHTMCGTSREAAHVHGCHADQVHVQVVGCVVLVRAGLQLGTVVQAAAGSGSKESACCGNQLDAMPQRREVHRRPCRLQAREHKECCNQEGGSRKAQDYVS